MTQQGLQGFKEEPGSLQGASPPTCPFPGPPPSHLPQPQQPPWPHLLGLLVEHCGHGQDGAALVQGSREALPLLVQLRGDLLDLLRGIVAGLREAGSHGHDAVDVDIGILEGKESERFVAHAE